MARVLVVDDDAVVRELLRLNLKLEGHEVAEAADGQAALAATATAAFDVVLLDVMMPAPDGYEVCAALRADPATADLPVILLTAMARTSDRVRGLDAGADAFVTKPFDPLELVQVVADIVGDGRP